MASIAKERTFIPSWNKNTKSKKADSDRLQIIYKVPTAGMKERLFNADTKYVPNANGDLVPSISMDTGKRHILKAMVVEIKNFPIEDDKTEDISLDTLFDELPLESGSDKLIDEIYTFLMDVLKGTKKKDIEKN